MDEKILAVPSSHITQRFDHVNNFGDLPEITLHQIEYFFAHYKDLGPGKWVKTIRRVDAAETQEKISQAVQNAQKIATHTDCPTFCAEIC